MWRWLVAVPLAGLIAAALFLAMSQLIEMRAEPAPIQDYPDLVITAKIPETRPDEPDDPRPDDLAPPDPQPIEIEKQGLPDGSGVDVSPTGDPAVAGDRRGGLDIALTGSPIVVAPPYPERCAAKGAQGEVVARFDVNPDGAVSNVEIVRSPDSCFDRPVARAIERWRYPPRAGADRRESRTERFTFVLEER